MRKSIKYTSAGLLLFSVVCTILGAVMKVNSAPSASLILTVGLLSLTVTLLIVTFSLITK